MRRRRAVLILAAGTIGLAVFAGSLPTLIQQSIQTTSPSLNTAGSQPSQAFEQSRADLNTLEVKGRAPKTGYDRNQFGNGWATVNGCSTRDIILYRDLLNPVLDGECTVVSGELHDPYTGEVILFNRQDSQQVQIDHVVALSDSWQKGAQHLSIDERKKLANDPLELLAVSGKANQEKGDSDAASWLPKNKQFRCDYVKRQIKVKVKYRLWVTPAEKQAMENVLQSC